MRSVRPSAIYGVSFRTIWRAAVLGPGAELTAAEASSTIYRFFRSKHVVDLKVIAMFAMTLGMAYMFAAMQLAM